MGQDVTQQAFDSSLEDLGNAIAGPWRSPRQMLQAQTYDKHSSIHDEATAAKLGFKGAAIEGPTHFSQFAPLGAALWGKRWFEDGCLSAHYRNMVVEGEKVRAFMAKPAGDPNLVAIWAQKEDGTEVLKGTASVGSDHGPSALEQRLATLPPLEKPVILHDVKVGMKLKRHPVRMAIDQNMGALYPFSLREKLAKITEPSPWYDPDLAEGSPFSRAVIPFEMISVLGYYSSQGDRLPTRGPAIGLVADQEIRLIRGPLFVGEPYEVEREVVALSGSRRTESVWMRANFFAPESDVVLATMLLNSASLIDSYARYAEDRAALWPE
jgi:hypothetical protein